MANTPVSIREVAAYAGVSIGTVSNVLNRPDASREPTRSRVQAAIDHLGFISDESARQLRAGRSRTIGLIVLDMANPFFTDVAAGSRSRPRAGHGRHPVQHRRAAGRGDPLPRAAGGTPGTGVPDHPGPGAARTLAQLRRRGTPSILVDRGATGRRCSVSVDVFTSSAVT